MFKVFCVKKFFFKCGLCGEPMPNPEVGDIDTVIEVVEPKTITGTYYALERFGKNNLFNAKNFAILPDQSADQMSEEKHEAIIYQR